MRVSLIYEGLHEVCPLCRGDSHQLDNCPKLPSQKKIQVVVQTFEENSDYPPNKTSSSSVNPPD